ncbi:MAG: sporulation protein [Lachnospiraceae bacterium]|nr:sporulation protein [Lachnospiraceae bacterium]
MAENKNKFSATIESMFESMKGMISSKTVVGEPVIINENTFVLPLMDVSVGVGAGANVNETSGRNLGGGGLGAKFSPSAVLVVQDGAARIINIQEQDKIVHLIETAPDTVKTILSALKKKDSKKVDAAVESAFDDLEI